MIEFNLEEYIKNPKRQVKTIDGRPARILCTNLKRENSIVAAIKCSYNSEEIITYNKQGKAFNANNNLDLTFVAEKQIGYVIVVKNPNSDIFYVENKIYKTKKDAEIERTHNYQNRYTYISKIMYEI